MIPSQQTCREEEHRHAITEILFFASIGDVTRMKALADKYNIYVRAGFPEKLATLERTFRYFAYEGVIWKGSKGRSCLEPFAKSSPELIAHILIVHPVLFQVSDASCCDYDKRTPL